MTDPSTTRKGPRASPDQPAGHRRIGPQPQKRQVPEVHPSKRPTRLVAAAWPDLVALRRRRRAPRCAEARALDRGRAGERVGEGEGAHDVREKGVALSRARGGGGGGSRAAAPVAPHVGGDALDQRSGGLVGRVRGLAQDAAELLLPLQEGQPLVHLDRQGRRPGRESRRFYRGRPAAVKGKRGRRSWRGLVGLIVPVLGESGEGGEAEQGLAGHHPRLLVRQAGQRPRRLRQRLGARGRRARRRQTNPRDGGGGGGGRGRGLGEGLVVGVVGEAEAEAELFEPLELRPGRQVRSQRLLQHAARPALAPKGRS